LVEVKRTGSQLLHDVEFLRLIEVIRKKLLDDIAERVRVVVHGSHYSFPRM
jgi:hypothetical protein